MGLLDDAIREHLELKRQHGADPGEVSRQEQEALGPVRRGRVTTEAEPGAPAAGPQLVDAAHEVDEDLAPPARLPAEDLPPADEATQLHHAPEEWGFDDDLEAGEPETDEPGEDPLEGTPDFLEETPEHDHLWSEQKPPRDFDFDDPR